MPDSSEEKSELITAIQEIVLAFTGAFDLDTLLQKIIEIFINFSNSDRGLIFTYEPSTQRLVLSRVIAAILYQMYLTKQLQ